MTGSRSNSSRAGGTSSLEALSRTIEGLEARIEDLIGGMPRQRDAVPAESRYGRHASERDLAPSQPSERTAPQRPLRRAVETPRDPLSEIRERQRALDARATEPQRSAEPQQKAMAARESRLPDRLAGRVPAERPAPMEPVRAPQRASLTASAPEATAPSRHAGIRAPQETATGGLGSADFTRALADFRQDLKKDLSEDFSREIAGLRSEIRSIRTIAEKRQGGEDFRAELTRLAENIKQLGAQPRAETESLRAEFEDLRTLMEGLAREESLRHMGSRWQVLEQRLPAADQPDLRDDIAALGERIEAIRTQLGTISDSRSVRMLEDKLIAVAHALEQIGAQFDPQERAFAEHFQGMDQRLDEISRAIASGMRAQHSGVDAQVIGRLEDRLTAISLQIDALTDQAALRDEPVGELGERIDGLSTRIEELLHVQSAARLEERIEHLALMLEEVQRPLEHPELTGFLSDISRKIDALDQGDINDRLAERLEQLAHRIDTLEIPVPIQEPAQIDQRLLRGLEERLDEISEQLASTQHSHDEEPISLKGLEAQIASLAAQLSAAPHGADPVMSGRISALEEYMATNDEYIIEAARQAAEAVMENYAHAQGRGGFDSQGEMETLSALADNLRQLEQLSRGSEERTSRTFETLQSTLQQIVERLDRLEGPRGDETEARREAPRPAWSSAPLQAEGREAPASRDALAMMAEAKLAEQRQPASTPAPAVFATAAPVNDAADNKPAAQTSLLVGDLVSEPRPSVAKPSLLAGLGKRLLPGSRREDQAKAPRTVVSPTPSMDPADILPPEEANELLEPGSGAPDVRKILERVRASQAQRAAEGRGQDEDRTDYIAAARRAAQAAAEEIEEGVRHQHGTGAEDNASGSLLTRYRRPILLAIGAILLAAMAMPLVSTLTRNTTPAPQIEAKQGEAAPALPGAALPGTSEDQPASGLDGGADVVVPPVTLPGQSSGPALNSGTGSGAALKPSAVHIGEALAPAAPTDAARGVTGDLAAAPLTTTEATDGVDVPADGGAAASIAVPAEIKPDSLATAAGRGDALALFEIGSRYTEGRGVKADLAQAARWYQLAADRGFAPALYRLANLYEKGSGVERNIETAKKNYEMAAALGNASAMHNLAVLYASGADGRQDYAKAANWFSRAAELGVTDSQFNLAILLARGNGVKQDLEASYKWFAIAAKDGDQDAAQKRDEVANSMQPQQLDRAKAAVESWKATPLDVDANSVNPPDEWVGTALKTASVDMKKAVQNIQAILNRNGYDAGTADGVMGKKTVTAIEAFQRSIGQEPTGKVTDALVKELLARNK